MGGPRHEALTHTHVNDGRAAFQTVFIYLHGCRRATAMLSVAKGNDAPRPGPEATGRILREALATGCSRARLAPWTFRWLER